MNAETSEIKHYQPRFARWIQSAKWDDIAERLSETYMNIIIRVMNAEKTVIAVGLYGMNAITFLKKLEKLQKN